MKLYFSGNSGSLLREQTIYARVKFPHRCLSYAYLGIRRNDQLTAWEMYKELGKPAIFMDSGAFTLQTDKAVTIKEAVVFAKRYATWVKENAQSLEHYVSVDWRRNGKISWDMQKRMEDWGLKPLPVYHAEDDFIWFEKLCAAKYPIVCVSKPDRAGALTLDRLYKRVFSVAKEHGTLVHGLSETGSNIFRYPFYSVDSTSWLQDAGRGYIIQIARGALNRIYVTTSARGSTFSWDSLPEHRQKELTSIITNWGYTLEDIRQNYTMRAAFNAQTFLQAKPPKEVRFNWERI